MQPVLDSTYFDGVFKELGSLVILLDADPLALGPKRLNAQVADARKMLDRCERVFLQVAQETRRLHQEHSRAKTDLKLAKMNLFANDPETRSGRNVADREAIATGKLIKEETEVNRLALALQDVESVMVVIRAKRADLKDAQGRLRDQIRLCQEELGLGGRWGSKLQGAPDLPTTATEASMSEVDALLAQMGPETHLPEQEEPEVEPPLPTLGDVQPQPAPVEPQEAASPELDLDVSGVATSEHLPASVPESAVDAFLSGLPDPPSNGETPKKDPFALDEDVLDSLLDSFK